MPSGSCRASFAISTSNSLQKSSSIQKISVILSLVIIFLSRTQVIKDFLSSNDADKAENHLILRPQIGPTYYVFYACLIKNQRYSLGASWGMVVVVLIVTLVTAVCVMKFYDESVRNWLAKNGLRTVHPSSAFRKKRFFYFAHSHI